MVQIHFFHVTGLSTVTSIIQTHKDADQQLYTHHIVFHSTILRFIWGFSATWIFFSVVWSKLQSPEREKPKEQDIIFPLVDLYFPQWWAGGLGTIRGFSCGSILPPPIKSWGTVQEVDVMKASNLSVLCVCVVILSLFTRSLDGSLCDLMKK